MNEQNKIPVGQGPLTALQLRMLSSAAHLIVPPDAKSNMPGASEIDLNGYLAERRREEVQMIIACVDALAGFVTQKEPASEEIPDESARNSLISEFAQAQPDLWQLLVVTTYSCYYQDERVLLALGMDARPPFPRGNEVEAGDLSLLNPVRERGAFYR